MQLEREKNTPSCLCPINMPSIIISMLYQTAGIALRAPIIHIYWHPKQNNKFPFTCIHCQLRILFPLNDNGTAGSINTLKLNDFIYDLLLCLFFMIVNS